MKQIITTSSKRIRRHAAIRSLVSGTATRPRLAVFRSNKNIYAQIIDDIAGNTLCAASDLKITEGTKTQCAQTIGTEISKKAQKLGITTVVFDRGGFKYTGRVKALADSAREAGLVF